MADANAKKAAKKEGGKKGIDLIGMSDLGGVKFFNVCVESANGDLELLDLVLEGMNTEVDESAEERKGGAGALGKLVFSAGDKQIAMICHVPKALAEEKNFSGKEWVEACFKVLDGAHIVEETAEVIKAVAPGNPEKGHFPLKMRDAAQTAGFGFLRAKGLLPDDDDSDDYIPDPEAAGIEW